MGKTVAAEVQIIPMTEQEARTTVRTIKADLDNAGRLALELRRRGGWESLGYASWAECAKEEFGRHVSQINKQMAAEEVRSFINSNLSDLSIRDISDAAIEPLASFRKEPELLEESWEEAKHQGNGKPTASQVRQAVDIVLERHGLNVPRAPLPGQTSFLDQPAKPDPYRLMHKCIDQILSLLSTINAPDTPEQRGLGGVRAVVSRLSPAERREIGGYVVSMMDSLQEWAEALGVQPNED